MIAFYLAGGIVIALLIYGIGREIGKQAGITEAKRRARAIDDHADSDEGSR